MKQTVRNRVRRRLNSYVLHRVGLRLVREDELPSIRPFIPFKKTLAAARAAGLSVGDYIDARWAEPGATQQTIDGMKKLGVFDRAIRRVCEIGPGSGRYLEKTIAACHPSYYEIYETAPDWEHWLVRKYKVTAQHADGFSLSGTADMSIDLVQAHKVLVDLDFVTSCHYMAEMARVVRDGCKIVFDVLTENCMDEQTLQQYWALRKQMYTVLPRQYTLDLLARRGVQLDGSFFVAMPTGQTECMVFTKYKALH
jgi:hypothetical protein